MRAILFVSATALAVLAGCTSTYHPEYHPVTVTSYEQHVGYPAGQGAPPPVTMSAPEPQTPPPPPPWSAWPSE